MKKVVIVAAHFVPSNLTAVHRSRLWVSHLQEFGWEPTIVTTHWDYYEESVVPDLHDLVPDELEVVRTSAIPAKWVRPLVGDIGLRAFHGHYRALCRLAEQGEMDFLHITIPSFYSALLGRLIHSRYGIPYGIDYIDPWVHEFPVPEVPLGPFKSWMSEKVAQAAEPWAVRDAALITGVDDSYFEGVLERNPHLREQAITAAMPYGGASRDHKVLRQNPRDLFLWDSSDKTFNFLYAGAMLPKAYPVLERLFEGVRRIKTSNEALYERFALHFVGTGSAPDDPDGHNVQPIAEEYGIEEAVHEHPARIPYLDVLSHLQDADGALIVGSTERHYTPSKTYQAVQSQCPIWALLHAESSATDIIRRSNAGRVVSFEDGALPSVEEVASSLYQFVEEYQYDPENVRWELYDQYSARETTRVLADALDEAYVQSQTRS
ncbi:glycosyltransferase [Salinibacter sp.]|uniref:glycosyltransferase n=1 Tax=Salinibacter sp. TaxID=2065818 RepID=UPI0021E97BFF|nr:glycosyltransferase [Salinibacter sp.]